MDRKPRRDEREQDAEQPGAAQRTERPKPAPERPTKDFSTIQLPAIDQLTIGSPPADHDDNDLATIRLPVSELVKALPHGASGRALTAAPTTPQRAVAPTRSGEVAAVAPPDVASELVIIPGSGRVAHHPYTPRRPRPLVMRLTVAVLIATVVFLEIYAVGPLGLGSAGATGSRSPFQALAGAVMWQATPSYRLYIAREGDTVESIALRFGVQIGGIYELNGMLSGEELQLGKAYKIPTDPTYGLDYRPSSSLNAIQGVPGTATNGGYYGPTIYGDHIWNSEAGIPPDGALCGPTPRGSGDNLANYATASFDLKAPNWGAYWVRGFTWYHFGVDLANPEGTPIHAAQSGEVIFAAWDTGGGGWSVKINHCNHLSTAYGHMDKLLVHVHQMVTVGQVIGLEGSTGWSTGPHLHFSTQWDNIAVDPMQFFGDSKYAITTFRPD
jgi:murein DD-endopeptidase MepM/ murein hydrolase activator NlpD